MSSRDLFLAIDVGTGSVRSALVDANGQILAFEAKEHAQILPRPGWAEQKPSLWWEGTVETTRAVLKSRSDAPGRIVAVAACGQMHATVLINSRGKLVSMQFLFGMTSVPVISSRVSSKSMRLTSY